MQKITIIVCSILEMARLLQKPKKAMGMSWITEACQISRQIHIAVWMDSLSHTYVREVVLKYLLDAICAILDVVESKGAEVDAITSSLYIRNILKRALNIQNNYLHNRRTEFPPNDKLLNRSDYIWTYFDDPDTVISRISSAIAA